jgi:uncharacterized membrane protein HdeD (DUF308 family)
MFFNKTILTNGGLGHLGERVEQHLRDHKGKYIFQGIIFIVAGVLSAMLSSVTVLHTELLVGIVLLVTGMFQLVLTLKSKMHWWSLLSAGLSIFVGLFIVWKPFPVLISIVTLLAVFMTRSWNWMIFSSIVTLTMAVVLWVGYPTFDILYLGWIVAVNLILYGLSLLMLVWGVADTDSKTP